MYAKGNPVLSKMFAHSGLILNESGLHYCLPDHGIFTFLITDDHVKIAEIAGFNYEEFDKAKEYKDFFKLLTTNPFFRPSKFTSDTSQGKNKMLKELADYLAENPCEKEYVKRTLEDMYDTLKEFNFEERHKLLLDVFNNHTTINKKFNGGTILAMSPTYDKRNLQEGFEKFNDSFPTPYERLLFLHTHTPKEIVMTYLQVTDIEHMFFFETLTANQE